MMTKLILWMIMSYGLMNIMVFGSIFQGFRNFLNKWGNTTWPNGDGKYPLYQTGKFMFSMISCAMCFSVWGGFFLGLFLWSPTNTILGVTPIVSWFFDGIVSSGGVWAINSIIEWFEENRPRPNQ